MESCIEWTGERNEAGYGRFKEGGRYVMAHRRAWEKATNEPIPPGKIIRHSCDNPPCVNPAHLLLGTQKQNVQDMMDRERHKSPQRDKASCSQGHPFDEKNTLVSVRTNPKNGKVYKHRQCRTCNRDRARARQLTASQAQL